MNNLLLISLSLIGFAHSATWSYDGDTGTEKWANLYSACGGQKQSPIDIPPASMVRPKSFSPFALTGYSKTATGTLKLKNNGHTAVLEIPNDNVGATYMSGGGLSGQYVAAQLHFHWGPNNHEGSEHTFRGREYPLEVHIVHYKQSYGSLGDSLDKSDGLAVLGFFFEVTEGDNLKMKPLTDALGDIVFKGESADLDFNFEDVMSSNLTEFYRYEGSLTTPTCNEAVVWTVFEDKNTISHAQLAKFRQLYETEPTATRLPMLKNYRPVQLLNSREVYRSYEADVPYTYKWGYEGHQGAESWENYYETCSGTRQSPVDIPAPESLEYNKKMNLHTLKFNNYKLDVTGTIKNNGHTIQVDIDAGSDMSIENGGLKDKYIAAQFHFHWGRDNMHGSEHTREGRSYPLELHIVHFNSRYETLGAAIRRDDGLAVVGFFFEVDTAINPGYAPIISALRDVQYKGDSKAISGFTLEDITFRGLYNGSSGDHIPFFRYSGGLTTPPCFQVVTWTVMMPPVKISSAQMQEFRMMTHVKKEDPINNQSYIGLNYRPTQPLELRKVYVSYDIMMEVSGTPRLASSTFLCAAILVLLALFR